MEQEAQEWKILKTVKCYSISTLILGEGTFAKTYLSRETSNPTKYQACKLINKNCMNGIDEETWKKHKQYFVSRLQEEVRIWKELQHLHVVQFQDILQTNNSVYIFLEYCEGGNLEVYINTHFIIPDTTALSFAKQLLACGNFLYSKGIIHRDIKPENILFSQGVLKVSDFGLAKILEKEDLNKEKTLTIAGSPSYMAPQVLEGKKYGLKCDVWSMGVIIYQLFMGSLPFELTDVERSGIKIVNHIKEHKLRFPRPLNMGVCELLSEMLELDPNNRLSMPECFQKIDKVQEHQITLH